MLRRKPTAITLTTEDIAIYEDARTQEAEEREQAAREARMQEQQGINMGHKSQNRDPNDELRPHPGARAPVKTREERLGLAGQSSRG